MLYIHICYENFIFVPSYTVISLDFIWSSCFRVSLVELLYLPSSLFIHCEGQKCLLVKLSLGIFTSLSSVNSVFLWNRQKQFMEGVPEIACKPLFNGMQTNLCYSLFLMLIRAFIYWDLKSGCENVWDEKFQFPSHSRKRRFGLYWPTLDSPQL